MNRRRMLIVTPVILMMVVAVASSLFITSPISPAQDNPAGIGLVKQATAACEDFGGLVSVYQGEEYTDAFSSVAYLGQGIVVAGKRSWNDFPPNIAIYRSTDYGLTWNTVPNPPGITGRHVYYFGQHDSRVFAGTGDEGNTCLLKSDNYGATWSVVLTTADLKTLAGTSSKVMAVFTPVYMGENRWLVNLRNDQTGSSPSPLCTPTSSSCTLYFLESLDDGNTWHAFYPTGIDTSARKMILTSDGTLLYAGFVQNHGMYVSHDGGYSFLKKSDFLAFAGMADLGNGVYLAGTYAYPPDAISIYKSNDRGETWSQKTAINLPTEPGYFRTIIKVTDNLVIAYASCSEFSQSDRCAEAYMSRDGGETWTDLGPAFIGPYGNMNAIYDTVLVKPGTFIATAQPDSNILRSINLPPVAVPGGKYCGQTGGAGAAITFNGGESCDPDGTIVLWEWNWGDGTTNTGSVNPTTTHSFSAANYGLRTVQLRVQDDQGAWSPWVSTTADVNARPVADFVGAPYNGWVCLPITFDGSGSTDAYGGTTLQYRWDWTNDGIWDTGWLATPTTTHTYLDTTPSGTYTVGLQVRDNFQCPADTNDFWVSNKVTTTVTISNHAPVVNINGPYTVNEGQAVLFSSAGTYDPDTCDTITYAWDFTDDGTPDSTAANPSYTYPSWGTYTVRLTVTDNHGGRTSHTTTVRVRAYPIANAGPDQFMLLGETVSFNGGASTDPDGTIVAYDWNFGDGSAHGTGVTTTHLYAAAGTYNVVLTVTDNDGLTDTDTAVITYMTSCDGINYLKTVVNGMTIKASVKTGLNSKLTNANTLCVNGQKASAIKTMNNFITQCNTQRGLALTNTQADTLVNWANRIIAALRRM